MKKCLLILLIFNLSGCVSYFKRKDCEQVNWYEHGKNIALRGEWVSSDQRVSECRKVEAKIDEAQLDQGFKNGMERYCNPTNSYAVGKGGEPFSRDLCEGPQINSLLREHARGVRDYCDKSNGYSAGSSGKKYKNLCPSDLEKAFLPEYKRGRKKFVEVKIQDLVQSEQDLNNQINMKRMELSMKQSELYRLENEMNRLESDRRMYLSSQNLNQVGYVDGRIGSLNGEISSRRHDVQSVQYDISDKENKKNKIVEELSNYRSELPGLE